MKKQKCPSCESELIYDEYSNRDAPFWFCSNDDCCFRIVDTTRIAQMETDSLGKEQHEKGAKLDAGKPRMGLVLHGFARALLAVGEIGTLGADKYTDDGWIEVPNGIQRYTDAQLRHNLKSAFEEKDPEWNKLHMAHEAWNCLAKLELYLREKEKDNVG